MSVRVAAAKEFKPDDIVLQERWTFLISGT